MYPINYFVGSGYNHGKAMMISIWISVVGIHQNLTKRWNLGQGWFNSHRKPHRIAFLRPLGINGKSGMGQLGDFWLPH